MLLRDATVNVLAFDLVVQTLLDFTVCVHGTLTVRGLQLQGDVLLLGLHQQSLSVGAPLFLLLVLDGLVQLGDVFLPVGLPFAFDFIDFLVAVGGDGRSELLHGIDDHDGQRQAVVVLVLHDVDFLGAQVGDQASTKHVRSGDTGLVVEEGEPFFRQETETNLSWLLSSHWAVASGGGSRSAGQNQRRGLLSGGQKSCSRKHFGII
uniref:Putative secreted protein n=1 Tax=Psorophora albipes TaxID=869069 RepID=T1DIS0_9DIPT